MKSRGAYYSIPNNGKRGFQKQIGWLMFLDKKFTKLRKNGNTVLNVLITRLFW